MDEWLTSCAAWLTTTPSNGSMCSLVMFSQAMAPFSARNRPMLPDPLHRGVCPFECAVRSVGRCDWAVGVRVSWCAGAVCVEYGIRCVWRGAGAVRARRVEGTGRTGYFSTALY